MKYLKVGFCLAFGWYLGDLLSRCTTNVVLQRIQKTERYQTYCAKYETPEYGHKETRVIGFARES